MEKRNDPGVREHLEVAKANVRHVLQHLEDSADPADCIIEGMLMTVEESLNHIIEERLDD